MSITELMATAKVCMMCHYCALGDFVPGFVVVHRCHSYEELLVALLYERPLTHLLWKKNDIGRNTIMIKKSARHSDTFL